MLDIKITQISIDKRALTAGSIRKLSVSSSDSDEGGFKIMNFYHSCQNSSGSVSSISNSTPRTIHTPLTPISPISVNNNEVTFYFDNSSVHDRFDHFEQKNSEKYPYSVGGITIFNFFEGDSGEGNQFKNYKEIPNVNS